MPSAFPCFLTILPVELPHCVKDQVSDLTRSRRNEIHLQLTRNFTDAPNAKVTEQHNSDRQVMGAGWGLCRKSRRVHIFYFNEKW